MTKSRSILFSCISALLLFAFAGCQTLPVDTPATNEPSTASTTATTLGTETTSAWDGVLRSSNLKAFFEKHKQEMLELAAPLLELKMEYAVISSGYGDQYYVDETGTEFPFDEDQRAKFMTYLAMSESGTNYDIGIDARKAEGKRIVSFSFGSMLSDARIVYMPDGYVELSHNNPNIKWTEEKLEDGWYSQFAEYGE